MSGARAALLNSDKPGSCDTLTTLTPTPTISYVKLRVLNANFKHAINNCRNLLEIALRTTNVAMREKIQEWLTSDAAKFSFDVIDNEEFPLARENEGMRQILSDLVHGPLGSLLSIEERRKVVRIVTPMLPMSQLPPLTLVTNGEEFDFLNTSQSNSSLGPFSSSCED